MQDAPGSTSDTAPTTKNRRRYRIAFVLAGVLVLLGAGIFFAFRNSVPMNSRGSTSRPARCSNAKCSLSPSPQLSLRPLRTFPGITAASIERSLSRRWHVSFRTSRGYEPDRVADFTESSTKRAFRIVIGHDSRDTGEHVSTLTCVFPHSGIADRAALDVIDACLTPILETKTDLRRVSTWLEDDVAHEKRGTLTVSSAKLTAIRDPHPQPGGVLWLTADPLGG